MSALELIAALLSALGVWLTIRRSMFCWPVSCGASLLYGWVFFTARLYADMTLQAMFCGTILYGWVVWHIDRTRHDSLSLRRLGPGEAAIGICAAAIASALWCFALSRWTDDPMPLADATLSGFSILGQIWTARRYPANWALWVIVDSCYVVLFYTRTLYPTAFLYAAFVILAAFGLHRWRAESRA